MGVKIRGYAIPFNQLGSTSTGLEVVMQGAFGTMLAAARQPVRLQFDSHEDDALALASTEDGTLTLFEDEHGLAFEAELDEDDQRTWEALRAVVLGDHFGCSVNFLDMEQRNARFNGTAARHVDNAWIDHITISDSPAYKGTRVWRADVALDDADWSIRDLNDKWERGFALHLDGIEDRAERVANAPDARKARAAAAFRISNRVTDVLLAESPMRRHYERARSGTQNKKRRFNRLVVDMFRLLQSRVDDLEQRLEEKKNA